MKSKSNLMTRRAAIASVFLAALSSPVFLVGESTEDLFPDLRDIQKKSGGRLGCAVLDTSTGRRAGIRLNERFPMCSTFKVASTAFVLHRVDQGIERLDRRIVFSRKDLLSYAPISEKHVGPPGMTVAEICQAAMTWSDNTAANLLLDSFGGPKALTAFLRSIGDPVTRLDRTEPALNEATPGDPRDSTTPAAMLEDLHRFVLGNTLGVSSRSMLANWMVANTTGGTSLRAGMPGDWKIGDKTGSGGYGSTNDMAVIWTPHRAPVLVTAYLTECSLPSKQRYAILADVGRAVAGTVKSTEAKNLGLLERIYS